MKAICIKEPGKVEIQEIAKPERKPGEALLKLLYGGICGSDLGSYRGANAYVSYPRIPGHEFSAEIVEIDENEEGLKPGMIVTCNPYFNCGTCYSCRRGLVNACTGNETMGVQREGAFAEYITMPVERIYDGKGLDPKVLTLIEPFCISYHGVQRANVKAGEKVLVVGAGTIGVLAAVAAKAKGAEVTICDVAPDKLEYACRTFGLDHKLLNESPEAFAKGVAALTDGNGFDVTIEAVGMPETFMNCIDAACFGARDILSIKEVRTPSDLSGLKLRVSSNDLSVRSFEDLGATPVGMDMGDVYQAMSGGTIDAVENPITSLYNRSFQEVAKYLTKNEHILATSMWICGESFFTTLTEEQQQILMECADEAGLYNNELYDAATEEAEQGMKDAGVTVIELTDDEKAQWVEAAQKFFDEASSTLGWTEGLYDTVKGISTGAAA